jgi:crotonobetainyl-CoA:carnitine CoA-transferase CaiB-like acyl-CoA transferase
MRHIMPVPDAGAIKVLQGKESVALDLAQPRGRELLYRLVRNVDLVLASYRGNVAERLGVDYESLRRQNPRLVYLNAPGYGVDGPCARKPAFAPTIGAAVGAGRLQAGPSLTGGTDLSLDDIKKISLRLNWAAQAPGNADGASALGVATALLLGLIGRARGGAGQELRTSMLCTTAYALSADSMGGERETTQCAADPLLYGLGPLYRLYEASEGWIFLACPQEREWADLCRALAPELDLIGDARFATAADRGAAGDEVADLLAAVFRRKPASEWEEKLTAHDVACVEVAEGPISRAIIDGPVARAAGLLVEVEHAAFGRHERLAPLATLSRHRPRPGSAPRLGAHTEAVLREIGCDDATILELERAGVVHLEPSLLSRKS